MKYGKRKEKTKKSQQDDRNQKCRNVEKTTTKKHKNLIEQYSDSGNQSLKQNKYCQFNVKKEKEIVYRIK